MGGLCEFLDQLGVSFLPVPADVPVPLVTGEDRLAVFENHVTLDVDELVVTPGVAVHLQELPLGDPLCVVDHVEPALVGDLPFVRGPVTGGLRCVVDEQVVVHAHEEEGITGITLPTGPAAQLPVQATARVAAEAQDEQATASTTRSRSDMSLPPNRMSVPRPAICVETVMAP